MKRATRGIFLLLAVCLALSLAACGGKDKEAVASTMRLRRTEGQVDVSDQEKAVPIVADMLLYSGYRLATQLASYGWIALDETKLTKMDESSDVSVQQQGKDLALTVNAGSLFFLVTQPLAEDETFTIRCSDMVTGIRGTCGWVRALDGEHMDVYILEGKVECSVGEAGAEQTVALPAGQVARLSTAQGEQPIVTEPFTREDVPAFIVAEAEADSDLAARVLDGCGIDLLTSPAFSEATPEPSPEAPAAGQTAAPATGIAAYDAILTDYLRLFQLSDDEFPAAVEQVQNVDRRILERCRMSPASSHMCYALADMNGDGVDELFMGESYTVSGIPIQQIFEVLLFDGQNAVRVISEESGLASFVTPYSDGILTTENYGAASFWRINDAGTALESVPATDELTATHPTIISTPDEQAPVAPLALEWVVLPVS